jgi:Cu(I)/Ag(I) efflux system periplasmic protein CusF
MEVAKSTEPGMRLALRLPFVHRSGKGAPLSTLSLKGNDMKTIRTFAFALGIVVAAPAMAAGDQAGHAKDGKPVATAAGGDMSDGEVRKVDKSAGKITLKHGEIKNLDMPGMTMVFQVKDPAMLDKVKEGDKVKFKVAKEGSAYIVTEMTSSK